MIEGIKLELSEENKLPILSPLFMLIYSYLAMSILLNL
jgi:hypothetical protein